MGSAFNDIFHADTQLYEVQLGSWSELLECRDSGGMDYTKWGLTRLFWVRGSLSATLTPIQYLHDEGAAKFHIRQPST